MAEWGWTVSEQLMIEGGMGGERIIGHRSQNFGHDMLPTLRQVQD